MKPTLLILSSNSDDALAVANGVRNNLNDTFGVDIWKEGFFDEYNTIPLWVFLKKLMCYDFAAVILTADDLRQKDSSGQAQMVPRDNVIFELGATMARLGPQKTFILTPKEQDVTLPSYFTGVMILRYESSHDPRGGYQSAVGSVCAMIKNHLGTLHEDAFHSDLPAQGLAIGYFNNFVERVYQKLREAQELALPASLSWEPECGFTVSVLIPAEFMNRETADRELKKLAAANILVKLHRDRDLSVYALPRLTKDAPLHLVDIPTTLLTATKVIEKIDAFWGNFGDKLFQQELKKRELTSFARKLRAMRNESQYDEKIVYIADLANSKEHLEMLQKAKPPRL